jgi:hypothetical protein
MTETINERWYCLDIELNPNSLLLTEKKGIMYEAIFNIHMTEFLEMSIYKVD